MPRNRISRRQLLTGSLKAAAAAAALSVVPRHVLGGAARAAPSSVLTHAIIGVGGMGNGHVEYVLGDSGARLVAISDVDADHLAATLKRCPQSCRWHTRAG